MRPGFYRMDIDEDEFRNHARENYEIGDPIDPEAIRHPVWVLEAAQMNYEIWSELSLAQRNLAELREMRPQEEDTA